MRKLLAALIIIASLVIACTSSASTVSAVSATAPCGAGTGNTYHHVLVWMLENHSESTTRGHMPYLDGVANKCAYTTHLTAITHPSLPNYLADVAGKTYGITDDAGPSSHPLTGPSIAHQLGSQWGGFHDGMPTNCRTSNYSAGHYIVHHNPFSYYTDLRTACQAQDKPFTALANALSDPATEPAYMFVVPNNCHNGHKNTCTNGDGSTLAGQALQADNFLKAQLPAVLNSPAYVAGDTLIEITWDEGKGTNQTIYTVLVAPGITPGSVVSSTLTAYSLLKYNEAATGVSCLAAACTANDLVLP